MLQSFTILILALVIVWMQQRQEPAQRTHTFPEQSFEFFCGSSPGNMTCPFPQERPRAAAQIELDINSLEVGGTRYEGKLYYEWIQTRGAQTPKEWHCMKITPHGQCIASTVMYGYNSPSLSFVPGATGLYCYTIIISYLDRKNDIIRIPVSREYCINILQQS